MADGSITDGIVYEWRIMTEENELIESIKREITDIINGMIITRLGKVFQYLERHCVCAFHDDRHKVHMKALLLGEE